MRLAILADIHANIYAFEPSLLIWRSKNLIRSSSMAMWSTVLPDNAKVIERIKDLSHDYDCKVLLGNHDDLICMWADQSL
ncbi:MAG: hypothetical protein R2865_02495 [Deinococcales bacterium]